MSKLQRGLLILAVPIWVGVVATAIFYNGSTASSSKSLLPSHISVTPTPRAIKSPAVENYEAPTEKPPVADRLDFQIASKRELEAMLRDPGSAQYSNVHAHLISKGAEEPNYVFCGVLNSKNAFGGYNGRQRFVAHPYMAAVEEGDVKFGELWDEFCGFGTDRGEVGF